MTPCTLSRLVAGLMLAISAAGNAHANLTYDYTGNPFTTIEDPALGTSITASVTFGNTIPPGFTGSVTAADILSWQISSGPFTLSSSTTSTNLLGFTFSDGLIDSWLLATVPTGVGNLQLMTNNESPFINDEVIFSGDENSNENSPGTWAAVPEPSPWSMIAVGGVALLGIMLRKKHRTA